jgi:putative membrane protein
LDTLHHASPHATLNALLNGASFVLLLIGWLRIRADRVNWHVHRNIMLGALAMSTAFLVSYLIYHGNVGSVAYPYQDWSRTVYFSILIPHVILASLLVPFILALVVRAFQQRFDEHRKLARWILPIWMFVSVSGVLVYLMLYRPWMG